MGTFPAAPNPFPEKAVPSDLVQDVFSSSVMSGVSGVNRRTTALWRKTRKLLTSELVLFSKSLAERAVIIAKANALYHTAKEKNHRYY